MNFAFSKIKLTFDAIPRVGLCCRIHCTSLCINKLELGSVWGVCLAEGIASVLSNMGTLVTHGSISLASLGGVVSNRLNVCRAELSAIFRHRNTNLIVDFLVNARVRHEAMVVAETQGYLLSSNGGGLELFTSFGLREILREFA